MTLENPQEIHLQMVDFHCHVSFWGGKGSVLPQFRISWGENFAQIEKGRRPMSFFLRGAMYQNDVQGFFLSGVLVRVR